MNRELIEQTVIVDPILYSQPISWVSNREALHRELVPSFIDSFDAAESSGSVQGLSACRACSGCRHVRRNNFIVGVVEFFFQLGRI
jgi:hypothetical protein